MSKKDDIVNQKNALTSMACLEGLKKFHIVLFNPKFSQ